MNVVIKGTGSYIPDVVVTNSSFRENAFYSPQGVVLSERVDSIIEKFEEITGIAERRYIKSTESLSEIAAIAAQRALEDAEADVEKTDVIIMAHNFGNVIVGSQQTDILPSIASKVKHGLGVVNPDCVAFDIIFGCPGWVQAMILARQYIISNEAKRVLVIGGETLSRVIDPFDRDSMIYADGAGAVLLEGEAGDGTKGIISTCSQTYSEAEASYLFFGESNNREGPGLRYLKMNGRKIYEFALSKVPVAMKQCLDKSGTKVTDLKKIFLHQANEKMDEAILGRFYKSYGIAKPPKDIMPMNISKLGNSSVASVPTLLDSVLKHEYPEHEIQAGDNVLIASVGAGMNISALVYTF